MLRKTGMDEHDAADCLYEFMKECHVVPVEQFVNWMMRQQGGQCIESLSLCEHFDAKNSCVHLMCYVFTFLASEYDCLVYLNGRIQCEHFELADMLTTNVSASTSGSFTMIGSDLHAGIDFVSHECLDFPECICEHEGELTVAGSEYMVPNE